MSEDSNNSLAYELLVDLRISQRRWFTIAVAELLIILAMSAGMFWYFSLPTEEGTEVTQESDNESQNNFVGGDSYGGKADR